MSDMDAVLIPGRGLLAEVDVSALVKDGDACTFAFEDRLGQPAEGFVLRWRGAYVAYENRCPHWSVPVCWDDETFLAPNGRDIVCPMHGARFEPGTGKCWEGPCLGESLERFEVELRGTLLVVRRTRRSVSLIG